MYAHAMAGVLPEEQRLSVMTLCLALCCTRQDPKQSKAAKSAAANLAAAEALELIDTKNVGRVIFNVACLSRF